MSINDPSLATASQTVSLQHCLRVPHPAPCARLHIMQASVIGGPAISTSRQVISTGARIPMFILPSQLSHRDFKSVSDPLVGILPLTSPATLELEDADVPLLKQLVAQKASHPQLKIIIALGGWDFSYVFLSLAEFTCWKFSLASFSRQGISFP